MIEINHAKADDMFTVCRLSAGANDIDPTDAAAGALRFVVQLLGEASDPKVKETILSFLTDTSKFLEQNLDLFKFVQAATAHAEPPTPQ